MKKLLKTLACSAVAALVGASALADYGWYDDSITIGSYTGTFSGWSGNPESPTDLGVFSDLTVSSVAFNIWSDANDRGGANMYFRVYDANGQVGDDQDIWLGGATRIAGEHDFSISYSTPVDLAAATGLTMEEGKTYYVDMWAKSYGDSGDEWYSNNSANYHAKFVYGTPKTYTLVESADDLVVGADYLVVSTVDGVSSALKNEINGDGIGVGVVAVSGTTAYAADDALVWQIKGGVGAGQRVLFNSEADVFAAAPAAAGDAAQLLADGTDALAQWTIDTSALPEVKIYSASYTDRYLQQDVDAANEWFAAYDSAQATPRLYRADSTEVKVVTFDANGGSYPAEKQVMNYAVGRTYWGIWKPTWEGHQFLGWFDALEGGNRIANGGEVADDTPVTAYAHWVPRQTVYFNANGGTYDKESVSCAVTYSGITKPTWDGHQFLGWYDAQEGGERVKGGMPVTGGDEKTLYAHWAPYQTVYFDPNGGTYSKESVVCAVKYSGFTRPTWDGHDFLGWWDAREGGNRVLGGTPVTGGAEKTVYAHWKEIAAAPASRAKGTARAVGTYTLVTGTLTPGNYVITGNNASNGQEPAMVAADPSSNNFFSPANVTVDNGVISNPADNLVWEVAQVSGGWSIHSSVGYVHYSGTKNTADAEANLSNESTWTITVDNSGVATVANAANTARILQYNSGSPRFACYTSSQKKLKFYKADEASAQSVTLNPAGPIEAEVGDEVIITATADGFSGDVNWSWTGNGTPSGNTFTVDTSAAVEEATVTATATYGTDETASQSVTVTVTAPKHTITIDSAIENGTVTTTPAGEAAEGATVKVTASPASGYKLGSILVNGVALAAGVNTFTMPSQDVTVSATFVELSGDVLTQANTTTTSGYTSWTLTGASGTKYAGISAGGNSSIQLNTATTASKRGIVITESTGRNVASVTVDWNENTGSGRSIEIYGRTEAYDGPADLHGDDPGDLLGELKHDDGDTTLNVTGDYPYIGIVAKGGALYLNSVTIEFAPVAVVPTVTVTASATEVLVNTEVTFTATAENFDAPASDLIWEWKVGETVDSTQVGTTFTWTPSAAGTYTVTATATDGDNIDDDSVTITVNAPPALHDVVVMTDGNGTAEADVEEALPGTMVTVTATPNADYRLDAITVNGAPITGTSFEMPNEDALVYVTFEGKHDIEVFAGDHGQASADKDKAYAGETVTLTVTPDAGYGTDTIKVNDETITGTSFEMPADDALVEVTFKEVVTYTLVESADDFVVGADYVIVSSGNGFTDALKNEANGNRIGTEAVTVSADGKTLENPSAGVIWQIKGGVGAGQRVLFNSAANVYAAAPGSAGNNAQLLADGTAALAQWTINLSDLPAVKIYSASYTDRYLQRNNTSNNTYFATYSSAQATPRLYRADSTEVKVVTFDANGGSYPAEKQVMNYAVGRTYWGIWKPTWEGHQFLGWFDALEGGNRIANGGEVADDTPVTAYAHWAPYQTVYFNANGGTYDKESVECAVTYTGITKPTWEGHKFLGWFDAQEGGERVKGGMPVTGGDEKTLYAHWAAYQTVYFDPNGGTYDKESVECAVTYTGITKPTWEGHKFLGWWDAREGGTRVMGGMPVTGGDEKTLYAHWQELVISSFSMRKASGAAARGTRDATDSVVLTFDATAGSVYDILWTPSLVAEWTVLTRVTAAKDGEMAVSVDVPVDSVTGFFSLRTIDVD